MSKLFDQIRKTRGELQPASPQMERVLEATQLAASAEQGPANGAPWIENCRKIHLPKDTKAAVLFQSQNGTAAAAEAYRGLRTRVMRLQSTQGIQSIVLSSSLPGEGKTVTALNLGLCCAQLHEMKVLVVDADLRTRGMTKLLGYPAVPGLAEVLAGKADHESAILSTDIPNLYFLGAGESTSSSPELFAGSRWKDLIAACARSFRLVLVDTPPILSLSDFELISHACDGVLLVVRALRTPRAGLRSAAAQIDSRKLLGVVYNGTQFDVDKNGYRPYHSAGKSDR